jgi:pyruvate formate lyase activating enzyme
MTPHAVEKIAPVLDAINVDLKAFRDETYREVMKARLEPVLDCLKALVAAGVWVEVTTLVVPGMNDSQSELADIAGFIAGDLGRTVPWHVSRFHADYRMDHTPTTPIETLQLATDLGRQAGLKHIYCGNVPGQADESTYCPACEKKLIDRTGFAIRRVDLAGNACSACGETIAGVFA